MFMTEEKLFYINRYMKISNVRQFMTTSFCSAATSFCFPKELKLFINDSDSKENENKVGATG